MEIPKELHDAMNDILDNYDFKKSEQRTIAMFIQTLMEYEEKGEKQKP